MQLSLTLVRSAPPHADFLLPLGTLTQGVQGLAIGLTGNRWFRPSVPTLQDPWESDQISEPFSRQGSMIVCHARALWADPLS